MTTYKLTRKAAEDLSHLYLDGVAQFGIHKAESYYAGLEKTFDLLATNPKLARLRQEITPHMRIHPYHAHLIVYMEDDAGEIIIVRIRHSHENWTDDPASQL